jgi:hypothetical protein
MPDGSIEAKLGWWRGSEGKLAISGRRLDASAPSLRAHVPDGYRSRGFQPTWTIFPTGGCWQITGHWHGRRRQPNLRHARPQSGLGRLARPQPSAASGLEATRPSPAGLRRTSKTAPRRGARAHTRFRRRSTERGGGRRECWKRRCRAARGRPGPRSRPTLRARGRPLGESGSGVGSAPRSSSTRRSARSPVLSSGTRTSQESRADHPPRRRRGRMTEARPSKDQRVGFPLKRRMSDRAGLRGRSHAQKDDAAGSRRGHAGESIRSSRQWRRTDLGVATSCARGVFDAIGGDPRSCWPPSPPHPDAASARSSRTQVMDRWPTTSRRNPLVLQGRRPSLQSPRRSAARAARQRQARRPHG